ncbi:hypothetical protein DMENIID0001_045900 [Sergentomyia squamirostris]
MAVWNRRKHILPEDFYLDKTCVVSKQLIEYLANYQIQHLRHLWKHFKHKQGCIYVTSESGLGKISTLLAFLSAIHQSGEKIVIYCRNIDGIHHWMLQMSVFWPKTSSLLTTFGEDSSEVLFVTPEMLNDAPDILSGSRIQYFIVDSRYSSPLTAHEINQIARIPGKQKVFLSDPDSLNNEQYLKDILLAVEKAWYNLIAGTEDSLLIEIHKQKFILKEFRKDVEQELPLNNDELYRKHFVEWRRSHPIDGQDTERSIELFSEEHDFGEKNMNEFSMSYRGGRKFCTQSLLSTDSGTPDLIFSEEEIVGTSSRVFESAPKDSSDAEDDVIPSTPDSEPLFRRKVPRRRILSTQTTSSSDVEFVQESLPIVNIDTQHDDVENRKKSGGASTPNLFETSDEESAEEKDKSALNTSTPLPDGNARDFPISQSPIGIMENVRKIIRPSEAVVDLTGEKSEVFEITENPTFSHQIRVSSRREVSPVVISSDSPKTPDSAKEVETTRGKWMSSSRKRQSDKSETPRSSKKSTGWLTKVSPKRSQHLTPRNLSVTFEVQQKEVEALRKSFDKPIITQDPEEGFPRKKQRLRDFLLSSDEGF